MLELCCSCETPSLQRLTFIQAARLTSFDAIFSINASITGLSLDKCRFRCSLKLHALNFSLYMSMHVRVHKRNIRNGKAEAKPFLTA